MVKKAGSKLGMGDRLGGGEGQKEVQGTTPPVSDEGHVNPAGGARRHGAVPLDREGASYGKWEKSRVIMEPAPFRK